MKPVLTAFLACNIQPQHRFALDSLPIRFTEIPMFRTLLVFALVLCSIGAVVADERIERAIGFAQRTNGKIFRDQVDPNWLPGGRSFWYRVATGPRSQEFVLVDCLTGERQAAATLAELNLPPAAAGKASARKTSEISGKVRPSSRTGQSSALKIFNQLDSDVQLFWIDPEGERVRYEGVRAKSDREQHSYEGHVWLIVGRGGEELAVVEVEAAVTTVIVDGKSAVKVKEEPAQGLKDRHTSPDGKYRVIVERNSLRLRNLETNETTPLQTDLDDQDAFRNSISWSPDSAAFVAIWCKDVPQRRITIGALYRHFCPRCPIPMAL